MVIIQIPPRLTPKTLLPFSIELAEHPKDPITILDFRVLAHVEPFGMLFLSALIRQLGRRGKKIFGKDFKLHARNFSSHEYASWMGFFRSFGLAFGTEPGEAPGGRTYVPLTRIVVSKIVTEAKESYVHHGEIIEDVSKKIAGILTRHQKCEIENTLTYSIRELFRNVIEHGNASHIWYAAQYWPTKNKVEVAILDEGVGLLSSLSRNQRLEIDSDQKAVFMALQPGISGVSKERRNSKLDGAWVNSGYGLFMTSSISKMGGSFHICSGKAAIHLQNQDAFWLPCSYDGVAIRMVLHPSRINSLNCALENLRIEGQKIARKLGEKDVELTASQMSRMLSRA